MDRFCQHRWPAIAGMVGFQNHVGDAPLVRWDSPSDQRIGFARGRYLHYISFWVAWWGSLAACRLGRLCSYQQRGHRVEHDIFDGLAFRIVLQCRRRLVN